MSSYRVRYLDVLRVAACAAVVLLHVAALYLHAAAGNWAGGGSSLGGRFAWEVSNAYDSAVRWGVPVFVMISGGLFLSSDRGVRGILGKNVPRLVVAYCFWSAAYLPLQGIEGANLNGVAYAFVSGYYHMWYIPMLVGLYLVAPLLRPIARDARLSRHFMALSLAFAFLIPQLVEVVSALSPHRAEVLGDVAGKLQLHLVMGYSGYYVLGYRLLRSERRVPVAAAALMLAASVAATAAGNHVLSVLSGGPVEVMYGNLTVNVLAEAVAVWLLAKGMGGAPDREPCRTGLLEAASDATFGVYLVHPMVIWALDRALGLGTLPLGPLPAVPVVTLAVVGVSFAVTRCLKQVPVLGKWVV